MENTSLLIILILLFTNIKIFLGINTMMIKIKLSFWQLVTIISGSR